MVWRWLLSRTLMYSIINRINTISMKSKAKYLILLLRPRPNINNVKQKYQFYICYIVVSRLSLQSVLWFVVPWNSESIDVITYNTNTKSHFEYFYILSFSFRGFLIQTTNIWMEIHIKLALWIFDFNKKRTYDALTSWTHSILGQKTWRL